MSQTILSVVLEVEPRSVGRLSRLIEELKRDEEVPRWDTRSNTIGSRTACPRCTSCRCRCSSSAHYDPIFVIEANFDGPPGPFWGHMEATLG